MDGAQQSSETIKHVADAIAIPGGVLAAFGNLIGLVNGLLTMVVLLTSIGWGVYRMIEMHRKLYPNK